MTTYRLSVGSLPPEEWKALAQSIRRDLDVPHWMPITPGAQIGPPRAALLSETVSAIMHPFPGQVIVIADVVKVLRSAGLTGFVPFPVGARWHESVRNPTTDPPQLFELFVTGTAWRAGIDLERITACTACGRTVFPDPEGRTIAVGRWDGSDMFHVDRNPNIIFVTDRVKSAIEKHRFDNVEFRPVPSSQ